MRIFVPTFGHLPIKLIGPISVAKVAEKVLLPQMPKQLILVQEAFITVLAARMAPMANVVRIANSPMKRQLLSRVASPLRREDLQVLRANVAVEQLVLLAHVLSQHVELGKVFLVASGNSDREIVSETVSRNAFHLRNDQRSVKYALFSLRFLGFS